MNVNVVTTNAEYRATRAVILYSGNGKGQYVSVHNIAQMENAELTIEAGVPATTSALLQLFGDLDPSRRLTPEFFDGSILSRGPNWMVWWVKPQVRRVWFTGEVKGSAEVPNPGLVFAVTEGAWSVFAIRTSTRPKPGTRLYQAPYFNVWDSGAICSGNVKRPEGEKEWLPKEWEDLFFRSYFSHPNVHERDRLVKYKGGPLGFWKDQLKGKFAKFPNEVLVPIEATVADLLVSLKGKL